MGQKLAIEVIREIVPFLPIGCLDALKDVCKGCRMEVLKVVSGLDGLRAAGGDGVPVIKELTGRMVAQVWNSHCVNGPSLPWEELDTPAAIWQWAHTHILQPSWRFPPGHFVVSPDHRVFVWALSLLSPLYTFHFLIVDSSTFLLYEAKRKPLAPALHVRD
eukprot:TRINITY_DN459_c0_g3_i1.p1 TRINITY_DN459_c0_g3~~TRINITY_DN459_c0_g3_i1.p1  ORF type:complete len:161 (+),score=5.16 TRINITY_DN459_c0_g3_i1:36-518(+)